MHLWPSLRIRDSFKHAYLQKLEFNLAHMKQARAQGQHPPDQDQPPGGGENAPLLADGPSNFKAAVVLELAWEFLMFISCCCCCFCCGACDDEDDDLTAR